LSRRKRLERELPRFSDRRRPGALIRRPGPRGWRGHSRRSKRGSRAQVARDRVPSGSPPKRRRAEDSPRSGDRLSQARRPSRRRPR
jgi:hypothetical protein